ncbi:putative cytochrome P450 [Xylariaceae sp. FL0662B]|nr:putative cytochrome P450 [Xylariaceae sp. FL0662B]
MGVPEAANVFNVVCNAISTGLYAETLASLFGTLAIYYWLFKDTKSPNTLPTYAPLEVFVTSACLASSNVWSKLLLRIFRYGSFFGVSSNHRVIYNLQGVERLLGQPFHTIDTEPVRWTLTIRVFGGQNQPDLREKMIIGQKELFAVVEKGFVNERNTIETVRKGHVEVKVQSLVTLSPDSRPLKLWERNTGHTFVQPETASQPGIAEVSLENLIRDFGAGIAITLLYGSDFLERNSCLLEDFWKFDNDAFPLLMAGVPSWAPMRRMRDGIAARTRLLQALTSLYERIDRYQKGEPVDGDLSDVGQVALQRSEVYTKHGFSYSQRGDTDLGILWGQNANTQPLIFWLLLHIYSRPSLLASLREEVSPFAPIDTGANPPRIVQIEYSSLSRDCPLLKSSYLETLRLVNDASSLRYVGREISVPDGPYTHHLKPGTFITVAHAINQRFASVYADPEQFVPDRFVETDQATGKRKAQYRNLRPWGMGKGICKGRTFAEMSILGVVAAVISLWDFEPADGKKWKMPEMKPGTGVLRPTSDVRVSIRRRIV